jgi:hypothetical protein
MQKIKRLYRSNYAGEELIREMHLTGGEWVKTSEYIPNAIENKQISGKAVVLGNGPSRLEHNDDLFSLLKNHKGGLLASGAVQTYGCNAIVRDFTPDFVVANDAMASELVNTGKCDDNIIYGTSEMMLKYPGKFYLIPQNPNWDAGSMAAYLACFDGHKQVYLFGFDSHSGHDDVQFNVYSGTNGYPTEISKNTQRYFEESMLRVIQTYNNVDFVRVSPTREYYMPESWKYQLNLRQITFRDFVIEVDLG